MLNMKNGIVALALLFFLVACSTTTEIDRLEASGTSLSEQDRALGERASKLMQAQYPMIYDEQLKGYIVDIRRSLLENTQLNPSGGQIFIVRDLGIFAYSLPNGDMFISFGILMLAQNDAEVASILAHELAHVHLRHAAKSRQVNEALAKNMASFVKQRNGQQERLYTSMMAVANYGRSRESEIQADRFMVELIYRSDYSVKAAWQMMQRLSELEDLGEHETTDRKGLFDTHPNIGERVRLVKNQVDRLGESNKQTVNTRHIKLRLAELMTIPDP